MPAKFRDVQQTFFDVGLLVRDHVMNISLRTMAYFLGLLWLGVCDN